MALTSSFQQKSPETQIVLPCTELQLLMLQSKRTAKNLCMVLGRLKCTFPPSTLPKVSGWQVLPGSLPKQTVFWDHCVKIREDGCPLKPVRPLPLTLKGAEAQSRIIVFYQQHIYFRISPRSIQVRAGPGGASI